ncbi:MAG TPA: 2-oxoglutarate and iron-dependent oxygenase domain-containing protein [Steroidobacteraceae bacterium]|nr:2-oxoglutarate and iron-dependent oxygenase domain-containing protein [Steroidobacteraceae bacterium]
MNDATLTDFDHIPVIDLGGLSADDPKAKADVAAALRKACTEVGFFYIVNHGVPEDLVGRVFSHARRLFDRPLDEKMQIHVKKSGHQLGYVANGDENANPLVGKADLHEAFDFVIEDMQVGSELWPGDFRKVGNQWPHELPGFQQTLAEYGVAMKRLAQVLFRAFAGALELPETFFDALSHTPMALVRVLYYPSQPGPFDETRMGNGAHTDHECFTILRQDDVQALQVRNRSGEWIDAPPIPGSYVVNIGDLMARWTNGAFASTYHRVANLSGRARYSIPCFIGPNADALIEALPGCTGPGNPPKFEPVRAGEYISTLIYHNFYNNQQQHPLKKAALKAPG